MKKKWYRSVPMKAALVVTLLVTTVLICLSGSLLVGVQGEGYVTPDNVLQYQPGKYEDSKAFSERMQEVSSDVLNEISAKKLLENKEGKYDANRLVDVMAFGNEGVISEKNVSGLAYTLGDLREWSMEYIVDPSNMEEIVVCKKFDDTYQYFYLKEFEALLKNGTYQLKAPEEMLNLQPQYEDKNVLINDVVSFLRDGYSPMDKLGYMLPVMDNEGKVLFADFWGFYQGCKEMKAPEGAKNILEVVNNTPAFNGKLEEVYRALDQTLFTLQHVFTLYEQNNGMWDEGNTNFHYFLVEENKNAVWTNDAEFENIHDIKQNMKKIQSYGKYVIVRPKLVDFKSNMDTSANDWRNIVDYTDRIGNDYIFAAAVDTNYPIQDVFYICQKEYGVYAPYLNSAIVVAAISFILLAVALVWLTICAGRNAEDEELHLISYDHWKTLFGAAAVIVPWLAMTLILGMTWNGFGYQSVGYATHGNAYYMFTLSAVDAMIIAVYAVLSMALFIIGYTSLVRRIKAKILWKNSVTYWALGVLKNFWKNRKVCTKAVILLATFVLIHWIGIAVSGASVIIPILFLVDLVAFYFIIRTAIENAQVRKGIEEIASGNVGYQISSEKMHGDSKEAAEIINNIGDGLNKAVAAAMKSERLKADLITNVSHDIKTPLTSIINYVDLLKRENFEDPKIQGYLEVLENKAQRLKTLTEDVVEASKVSSGNISLEKMDVNLVEMINQTIGEMSEKMEAKNLTVVATLPEEPAIVHVDGRRMWRVLENIFNNVAKYAMPGTRVYADLKVVEQNQKGKNVAAIGIAAKEKVTEASHVATSKKKVIFTLKNISENPLNINADELTERFIRGDVSRSTEGSGLGLSIARDLTEMQGGKFQLYVDGDLFKVQIEF